jgi:predicted nucleic acid-binding protein
LICTFDSNVLVYAVVEPPEPRGDRARELILRGIQGNTATLLFQALAEFSTVAMRKYGLRPSDVRGRVDAFRGPIPVETATEQDLFAALDLVRAHRIGFWDALLCATASRAGLRYLLSEDMQDGRRLGSLTIINPFRPENSGLIDHILPP